MTCFLDRKAGWARGFSKPQRECLENGRFLNITYYRWHQEYGGLKSDQIKRMKELETERQYGAS